MTTEIITATIDSINRKLSKSGGRGLSIVLRYEDGSDYGKLIYRWLWMGDDLLDNQRIDIKQWAALVDHDGDFDSAKEIIGGYTLFGIKVDLQVDTEPKFWKIINFGKEGTLQQAATSPPADDVPF